MAQTTRISGTVRDQQANEIMPGVSVLEKGTTNGTVTDANGQYTLSVANASATLVFNFISYETQEIVLAGRDLVDVSMMQQANSLSEIVVTALGLQLQSRDLGYAVQKLDARQISEVKSVNFLDNLSGKLAGVTVSHGSTGVGSTSKITIRGERSFSNNNPLFVVDGIPINNNSIVNFTNDDAAGFQEVDFGNGAMEVSSDDIASLTVLKGPAAAALYGTRASNGVILISTKDGSQSKGLGISFNSTTFLDKPFQLPQFQNKYGQGNSGKFEFKDGL